MYKSPSNTHQVSMFWDLASMLNPTHPMYKLANLINWETFERSFAPLYCKDRYCPIKVCKLLFLIFVFVNYKKEKNETYTFANFGNSFELHKQQRGFCYPSVINHELPDVS